MVPNSIHQHLDLLFEGHKERGYRFRDLFVEVGHERFRLGSQLGQELLDRLGCLLYQGGVTKLLKLFIEVDPQP
jgi:hypothetical protein